LLPSLLLGVALAEHEGRRLTKMQAAKLMAGDWSSTGRQCFNKAIEIDLLAVTRGHGPDYRKQYVHSTPKLEHLLKQQTAALIEELRRIDADMNDEWSPDRWRRKAHVDALRERTLQVRILMEAAQACFAQAAYSAAVEKCDAALALDPDVSVPYLWRMRANAKLGAWKLAARDCGMVISAGRIKAELAIECAEVLEKGKPGAAASKLLERILPNCRPDEWRLVTTALSGLRARAARKKKMGSA
jgi:tetratricopeptide (TPR) repeat protein